MAAWAEWSWPACPAWASPVPSMAVCGWLLGGLQGQQMGCGRTQAGVGKARRRSQAGGGADTGGGRLSLCSRAHLFVTTCTLYGAG